MQKQWHLRRPDPETVKAIQRHLKCSFITATILCNRKIDSGNAAADFISPSLYHLQPPFVIKDMDGAVERIEWALRRKERILIVGDYDVDGITATAVLFTFLKNAGALVVCHIPHRVDEGYGLTRRHIDQIAVPQNIGLVMTADNGSSSHNAIEAATAAGIDVIVTDHHTLSEDPPKALAVVNPKQTACSSKLGHLAGVGVAFCLLICLRKRLRESGYWRSGREPNLKQWLDLVALGTVADMVPLIADNRILTHVGIQQINSAPRPGIKALIESLNMGKATIDAEDIAFRLAPRLNAAGRMAHANAALELLLARNGATASSLSQNLNRLNVLRKETENAIIETIANQLNATQDLQKSIVVSGENWHAGVLGIVASRLTNKWTRPAIVFAMKDGIAKGSARSIPGVDIHAAISACKEDLIQFGGHASAAGLTLKATHIPRFKERFEETIGQMTQSRHFVEKIMVDCEIFFEDIDDALLTELDALQPFGQNNPAPLFMSKNIEILSVSAMGDQHRRMFLRQEGNARKRFSAVQFNVTPNETLPAKLNQIAFRLQWNHWNGSKKIQLVVEEM